MGCLSWLTSVFKKHQIIGLFKKRKEKKRHPEKLIHKINIFFKNVYTLYIIINDSAPYIIRYVAMLGSSHLSGCRVKTGNLILYELTGWNTYY